MAPHFFHLCTLILLTFSSSFNGAISAMDYQITNIVADTPGGTRFTNEIGLPYAKELMAKSNDFIWTTVLEQSPPERKEIDSVIAYIVESTEDSVGICWGNNHINFSALHIQNYKGDVKMEFTQLMYHEMTHVVQWNGEGTAPVGLVEGIADYSKLKADVMQPGFSKPGNGEKWDDGYDVTARFLEYCDSITPGFVAKLNKMIKVTYKVEYFNELTGKSVDQLWQDYKAKYASEQRPVSRKLQTETIKKVNRGRY